MMFSVQMHSRSKRHVNAQKIDVHATAVATILRPIGRPCANIIPPLSYSPATLFSSPPLPPPNQTKPNPTQPDPTPYRRSVSLPTLLSAILFHPLCPIPIYCSAPSDPTTPSFHPPIPFSALSPAPLPPSYRASLFFLSFHGAGDPCPRYRRTCYRDPFSRTGAGRRGLCCELPVHTDGYFRSRSKDSRRRRGPVG